MGDDLRPAGLLRRLPSEPNRKPLAWGPWLRWTITNGPIWLLIGATLALLWARHEWSVAVQREPGMERTR